MENIYSLNFQPQKNEIDMTENQIKIIEELIKERNYQKAETLLNKLLQVVPNDWQGKLLLGTCKLLQGDIEAAQKIHTEAEAHFESGTNLTENEKTFWKKYKKVFIGCGCTFATIIMLLIIAAICYGRIVVSRLQPQYNVFKPAGGKVQCGSGKHFFDKTGFSCIYCHARWENYVCRFCGTKQYPYKHSCKDTATSKVKREVNKPTTGSEKIVQPTAKNSN